MFKLLISCFRRTSYSPKRFSSSGVPPISGPQKIEEETLPDYATASFYDVRIGQVFDSRYQVVGKLGYGGNSTVWLSRDLKYVLDSDLHIDIKAGNILQEIEDESILEDFENAELEYPSPWKDDESRAIYLTRKLGRPKVFGRPVLCDLGQARYGNDENDDLIQPENYRAPEVILEMKWSYSVDIWNVGTMIWDLFEDKHLFNGICPEHEKYSYRCHLAEMVAYLGPPPVEFLRRSKVSSDFFDDDGIWNADFDVPKGLSLENSEENLDGRKKELFLQFIRKMLCWVPEERKTARELLEDPWLNGVIV
ncbi:hypothetical protein MMC18_002003 [Xylographa bjoerkii]|nr:hypothetical protein [Xylographa bjoerkii]